MVRAFVRSNTDTAFDRASNGALAEFLGDLLDIVEYSMPFGGKM